MSGGRNSAEDSRSRACHRRTEGGWTAGQKRGRSCRPSRTVKVEVGHAVSGRTTVAALSNRRHSTARHGRLASQTTAEQAGGTPERLSPGWPIPCRCSHQSATRALSCLSQHSYLSQKRHLYPTDTGSLPTDPGADLADLRAFGRVWIPASEPSPVRQARPVPHFFSLCSPFGLAFIMGACQACESVVFNFGSDGFAVAVTCTGQRKSH